MHVAPPENRLDSVHERRAAVVPEHLAQADVEALSQIVVAASRSSSISTCRTGIPRTSRRTSNRCF